jgi:hypothetical protein
VKLGAKGRAADCWENSVSPVLLQAVLLLQTRRPKVICGGGVGQGQGEAGGRSSEIKSQAGGG